MSASTVITQGFGSFGSSSFVITDGFGTTGTAPVVVAKPSLGAGMPRREPVYAFTFRGRELIFNSLEELYDWFLRLDEREAKGLKKKQSAMREDCSEFGEPAQSLRSRTLASEHAIRRFGRPRTRSRSTWSGFTMPRSWRRSERRPTKKQTCSL